MQWYTVENRRYVQSAPLLRTDSIVHGFTSRLGGVSHGKIKGYNLGFRVEDDPDAVKENYRLLSRDLDIPLTAMVLSRQTHTDHIRYVTQDDAGKGVVRASDIYDTDGLITDQPSLALVVFSADCVPILFFDPVRRVIAAVHAGWRGTVQQIAAKAVECMKTRFSCDPHDILCAIGPSIGPCCFQFGAEAVDLFPTEFLKPMDDRHYLVDIWAVNRAQLQKAGVPEENIDLSHLCTACHADTFYSYRTHGTNTGRQAAVIMLRA